jgi:hypothetical protein
MFYFRGAKSQILCYGNDLAERFWFLNGRGSGAQTAMNLNFADFTLERAVIELRYSQAYRLWDRSGIIWSEAQRLWPDLHLIDANPAKTHFRIADKLELAVELENARAVALQPKHGHLDEFSDLATLFFKIVLENLEPSSLLRVGMRFIYFMKFSDRDAASMAMTDLALLKIIDPATFGSENKVTLPEYAVRYEGKAKGFSVRIRAEGRRLDFEPPIEIEALHAVHQETFGIVFDIDHFTVAPMAVDQLSIAEWSRQASRLTKQVASNYFRV